MSHPTATIFLGIILLLFHNSKPESTGNDWNTAYEQCRSLNDSLPNIQDVQNNLSDLRGLTSIWSSVKGHFTPWIAYRGCFYEDPRSTHLPKKNYHLERNTVGNCYFQCKLNNETNGGCASNVSFFFRLEKSLCFCLCDTIIKRYVSESAGCHSCGTSFNDGECGGHNYYSLYETMDIKLPEAHFGGFCLTIGLQSDSKESVLYSIECNDNAIGYCVMQNGRASSHSPIVSTFASYWRYCKRYNAYIIGTTILPVLQIGRTRIWTGYRKYRIDIPNDNNESCYIIKMHNNTIYYKQRKCREKNYFLCKKKIGYNYISVTENLDRTSNKEQSSTNKLTIAGASVAGILSLTFLVFLVVFVLKRRRLHCSQTKHQANHQHESNNTTYDDLIFTCQRNDDNNTYTTLTYDKQVTGERHIYDGFK